jgi:hypothetical protein
MAHILDSRADGCQNLVFHVELGQTMVRDVAAHSLVNRVAAAVLHILRPGFPRISPRLFLKPPGPRLVVLTPRVGDQRQCRAGLQKRHLPPEPRHRNGLERAPVVLVSMSLTSICVRMMAMCRIEVLM